MRGMKKWLPFKSLTGQYEYIDKMKKEKTKHVKPELSLDQIDDLNQALINFKKGDTTLVSYFEDGQVIKKKAVFLKCDGYSKMVFFKGFSLSFSSLLSFE